MNTPARSVLVRLLRRGERARAQGREGAALPLTPSSCREYTQLRSLADMEAFEAEIALAERGGAIRAEPPRSRRIEAGGLKRLVLRDLDALATHLEIRLLSNRSSEAARLLQPLCASHPVLAELLDAWARGRKPRGRGPEAAADVADAARVFRARREDGEERILRRESTRLFADSKRIERLVPWLDMLSHGELAPSGLAPAEVLALLGLRREPQPLLLAGSGWVRLRDGARLPLVRPYLGLPMEALSQLEADAAYLLSIENLASFHEAARGLPDTRGLLVYTAGMPSPAWRASYLRLLSGLDADARVYHWGDIDPGGYRIAAVLAGLCADAGMALHPWCMRPQEIGGADAAHARAVSANDLSQMQYWACRAGWPELADALGAAPLRLEQEALLPKYPP